MASVNSLSTLWKGSGRMILSAVLFSAMSVLVKTVPGVSSYMITFIRFLAGLLILFSMGAAGAIRIKPVNLPWLAVRGFFGTFAVLLLYVGIAKIGLGKGTMLNYSYPVFAAAFSPLLVGEHNDWRIWISLVLALGGCYLILNPSGLMHFKGIELLVLSGALCAGVAVNSIRRLSRTDSPYTIYAAFCLVGVLMLAYPAFATVPNYGFVTWVTMFAIGILATVAQLLMTAGYRHVRVAEGSIIAFLVPVLNALLGAVIFAEQIGMGNILGGIVVIACCTYVSIRKQKPEYTASDSL